MLVHDLGPEAVASMTRVDLATVMEEPSSPIGLIALPGSICGIASFVGRPPWELHTAGDEVLHILSGECDLTVRDDTGETTRTLRAGDLTIVPQGCWHSNYAERGVTMMFITPREGGQHSFSDPATVPSEC
jgi:mannose-6-phosphate isomerase-like protein (cupin superfamily)